MLILECRQDQSLRLGYALIAFVRTCLLGICCAFLYIVYSRDFMTLMILDPLMRQPGSYSVFSSYTSTLLLPFQEKMHMSFVQKTSFACFLRHFILFPVDRIRATWRTIWRILSWRTQVWLANTNEYFANPNKMWRTEMRLGELHFELRELQNFSSEIYKWPFN